MTGYSNPPPPEGINNSETRPFREFLWLTGGVLGALVLTLLLLGLAAAWLAPRIPFDYEAEVAAPLVASLTGTPAPSEESRRIQAYLQGLANQLSAGMGLPEGMAVTVHYSPEETVNALATLGGHLVVYRGLIEALPHENALAMVLGHEIAHVLHRDPMVSLGRGVVVAVALGALAGVSGSDIAARVIGETGLLTQMHFSREQERDADEAGLSALVALYGHGEGALELFRELGQSEGSPRPLHLEFFETHPSTPRRMTAIRGWAQAQGWPLEGEPVAYPQWLGPALEVTAEQAEQAREPPAAATLREAADGAD